MKHPRPAMQRRQTIAALWSLGCLALLAGGVVLGHFGTLFAQAAAQILPVAVLATLPGQAVEVLMYAASLRALCPVVTFRTCLVARLLRDAADNILIIFPGLGEVMGTRALVLAGVRGRTALSVIMVDKVAETLAQLPFMALAGAVLVYHWAGSKDRAGPAFALPEAGFAALDAIVAVALLLFVLLRTRSNLAGRLATRIRHEVSLVLAEVRERKRGIPAAVGFHFMAWATDGVQVWMAAVALGYPLDFPAALVMASAAHTARVIAFFVPAGLVAQEAGFVTVGLAFGITAPQALTVALVIRLREVFFGLPLVVWPALEYRHRRTGIAESLGG